MKPLLLAPVVALLMQAAIAAPDKFSATVSSEQAAAAGLNQLTPAQVAALDTLVERYKSGELAAARAATERAVAARQAAETETANAKAAVARAEAQRVVPAPESPGVIARAKRLLKPSTNEPSALLESTITGRFRGWEPRQVLVLANGQRFQIANADRYFTPPVDNPRVQILPASFGGYWMRFPDLHDVRVRVNLLE